jgi:hypothetical protein
MVAYHPDTGNLKKIPKVVPKITQSFHWPITHNSHIFSNIATFDIVLPLPQLPLAPNHVVDP